MIIIDKPFELIAELQTIQNGILTTDEHFLVTKIIDIVKNKMNTFTYIELEK